MDELKVVKPEDKEDSIDKGLLTPVGEYHLNEDNEEENK